MYSIKRYKAKKKTTGGKRWFEQREEEKEKKVELARLFIKRKKPRSRPFETVRR
jgi:hypothetical protein